MLKAGVMEDGELFYPDLGTPQGGVISPLLSNIYLHEVLDKWFKTEVCPRLRGQAFLVRYADDFIIGFQLESDARRVMEVLPKRFGRYGLGLHPEKTRLIHFERPSKYPGGKDGRVSPGSFDFLGFTHYWGRSRKGNWVIKRKTAKGRLARMAKAIFTWIRDNRHRPCEEQRLRLSQKLNGHYQYFGITGNSRALDCFYKVVVYCWRYWLCRRDQHGYLSWKRFRRFLDRFPLPRPKCVHSVLRRGHFQWDFGFMADRSEFLFARSRMR